jgi:hypothetical protein
LAEDPIVLALIASVLLHEPGHAFVSSRYGIRTLESVMLPMDGGRMLRAAMTTEFCTLADLSQFLLLRSIGLQPSEG